MTPRPRFFLKQRGFLKQQGQPTASRTTAPQKIERIGKISFNR